MGITLVMDSLSLTELIIRKLLGVVLILSIIPIGYSLSDLCGPYACREKI